MQNLREKCKHRSSRAYGRHSRNQRKNFGPSSDRLGSTQDCSLLVLLKNLSLQICCSMEQRSISSGAALFLLFASLIGMRYVVPFVAQWPGTLIAVNVGGAVIPNRTPVQRVPSLGGA